MSYIKFSSSSSDKIKDRKTYTQFYSHPHSTFSNISRFLKRFMFTIYFSFLFFQLIFFYTDIFHPKLFHKKNNTRTKTKYYSSIIYQHESSYNYVIFSQSRKRFWFIVFPAKILHVFLVVKCFLNFHSQISLLIIMVFFRKSQQH